MKKIYLKNGTYSKHSPKLNLANYLDLEKVMLEFLKSNTCCTKELVADTSAITDLTVSDDVVFSSFTDSSATPGAATINKTTGRAAIAAAASSVVITNDKVTANSIILVQLETADATLTRVIVTPGAGSFTVTGNAAATATTKFSFVVINH